MHMIAGAISTAGVSRRAMLTGVTAGCGLSLEQLLARPPAAQQKPYARNCILFFLEGGPSHIDLWDMKPKAPAEIRGTFQPIATRNPELQVCEHLPLTARQMHLVTWIRSVHHRINDHNAGAYYALSGRSPVREGRLVTAESAENFPPFGAVLAHLRATRRRVPPFVHIPEVMFNNGSEIPGERAGFLGSAWDPLVAGDPSVAGYRVPGLALPAGMSLPRLQRRRVLLDQFNTSASYGRAGSRIGQFRQQASDLLQTTAAQRAFEVAREPLAIRERYGLPDRVDRSRGVRKFGGLPHLGQSLLLSRRLIEAGVRLVTVCTGRRYDQSWDTHRQHFPLLKRSLLPHFDRAFSALLEDLEQRGLLEETLLVVMGEFGRTPRLGQITSNAGADRAGRDHWPHCYSVLLAGGPVPRGMIYGASDASAAYPAHHAVTPEDVAATIYQALGIDPRTRILDSLSRPHSVALGTPIAAVTGGA